MQEERKKKKIARYGKTTMPDAPTALNSVRAYGIVSMQKEEQERKRAAR